MTHSIDLVYRSADQRDHMVLGKKAATLTVRFMSSSPRLS